jgi:hypothetical protein
MLGALPVRWSMVARNCNPTGRGATLVSHPGYSSLIDLV